MSFLPRVFVPAVLAVTPLLLGAGRPGLPSDVVARTAARLVAVHGESHAPRIERGVRQVAERWWPEDGDVAAFAAFCEANFVERDDELSAVYDRLTRVLEEIDGRLHEIQRELRSPQDLDTGPVGRADLLLGDLDLAAHVTEDLFATKVAFLALLNFPVHTLEDRLAQGASWSRAQWARSRMMDRFAARVPAALVQAATAAFNAGERYVAEYDIRADRLLGPDGAPAFPGREGLRLIAHWGLRDELKSDYGTGPEGLKRQRTIARVMERIVRQEIPERVRGNGELWWNPFTNEVFEVVAGAGPGRRIDAAREPDTRYARLLEVFRAVRAIDPYVPVAPTFVRRRFEIDRQIPERQVEALLVSVLSAPEVRRLAALIENRLGRKLEPFDIWYAGFAPRAGRPETELDRIVRAKYPSVAAFQAGLPEILEGLGFTDEKARWLAGRIVVDPSRGAGHAMGAVRRGDAAHLRTRVEPGGMAYKGYSIAVHELGHNVEQVFSLDGIDDWWLAGVPNNAFTEALAFVFQERDMELLGLAPDGEERRRLGALNDLWSAYEIAGVALVDMGTWRWMYEHPDATPAELRGAVLAIARDVWNRYYAPVLGVRDADVLAVYAHMISYPLYLPDYPVGHVIAFQVARKLRAGEFGAEFERMARQGRLTPDAWMRGAVGGPLSAEALLEEARRALATAR